MALNWSTATDWDSAQSESGVVHESVTNTDHNDATLVKKGYSGSSPYLSTPLNAFWPLHEDSGSTAYDIYNGFDMSVNGSPTLGATGLLGTTAWDFPGTGGDYASRSAGPKDYNGIGFTCAVWSYHRSVSNGNNDVDIWMRNNNTLVMRDNGGGSYEAFWGGSSVSASISNNTWNLWVLTKDSADDIELFKNATSQGTAASSANSHNEGFSFGARSDGTQSLDGRIGGVWMWDSVLSNSQIQTFYDVVATNGSLTTDKRSP